MCTFLRSEDCLRSLSATYHFTQVRALVSEIGRQLNRHTLTMNMECYWYTLSMSVCVWSACVRTEWISVVNALSLPPTQCLVTSLTSFYTHTHAHTHYPRVTMMPSKLNPSSTTREETNWQKSSSTLTIKAGSSRKVHESWYQRLALQSSSYMLHASTVLVIWLATSRVHKNRRLK